MHDEKLGEVLCETAEQMFFQEFEDTACEKLPEKVFWATIEVRQPEKFELVVAAAENEIREAIDMLFQGEKEATDARVSDMVAELANTIAGGLARHISQESHLELAPPGKGLGESPEADLYHAFAGEDLTLYVAVRPLSSIA